MTRKCENCERECEKEFYKCAWCDKVLCDECYVKEEHLRGEIVCEECYRENYLYACAVCDSIFILDDNEKVWFGGRVICPRCQESPHTLKFLDCCPKLGHGKLFLGYCKDCGKLYFRDGIVKLERPAKNQLKLDQFLKSSLLPSLEAFKEMNRVLKPGKWLYCMSSPRQDVFVNMCNRIEKAGFDIGFTSLYWCYLTGHFYASKVRKFVKKKVVIPDYIYEGFLGFNPTPAVEVIIVAMKPLSEKNYLSQALANRGGISRFERCRIPVRYEEVKQSPMGNSGIFEGGWKSLRKRKSGTQPHPMEWDKPHDDEWDGDPNGRYPANILCSDNALNIGNITVSSGGDQRKRYEPGFLSPNIYSLEGTETKVPHGYGDKGDYSRYFDLDAWWERFCEFLFIKKPSVKEKDAGLDDLPNVLICTKTGESRPSRINNDGDFGGGHKRVGKNPHISVKPIKLMSYLIEMGSDPGDIVVDPFCGSGTTGISAILAGRKFIGCDIDSFMINEVVPRRLKYWKNEVIRKKEEKKTGLGKWL